MILEINFNFGTVNYSGEETPYFLTIILPVLIAILAVMLTMLGQRFYDNMKKNESLDDLYKNIKIQANVLNKAANSYSENIKQIGVNLLDKSVENYKLKVEPNFVTDLILDCNTVDFYHSVVSRRFKAGIDKNNLINQCLKIRSELNSYKAHKEIIYTMRNDCDMKYNRYQDEWSNRINNFKNLLEYHKSNLDPNDSSVDKENSFIYKLLEIMRKWREQGSKVEKAHVYENVVEPALKLCTQCNIDANIFAIKYELSKAEDAYIEIANVKRNYGDFFVKAAESISGSKVKLEKAFQEIDRFSLNSKYQFVADNID